MKIIILFTTLIISVFTGTAFAKSDYTELKRATDRFVSTVEGIEADVSSIIDSKGTERLLNRMLQAFEDLRLELKKFNTTNPFALDCEDPPAEVAASLDKMMEFVKTQSIVSKLINKYGEVPEVQAEIKKIGESINNISSLKRHKNKSDQQLEQFSGACKAQFKQAYDLHIKAINNAKNGNCNDSLVQFETTIFEWCKLSNSIECDQKYIDLARDGLKRAKFDNSVARAKYCKDENATPNLPLQPSR